MLAPIIQAKYDRLDAIAATFGDHAARSSALRSQLQRQANALVDGAWQGEAALQFHAEMSDELLPALQRLVAALDEARSVTLQISEVIRTAEEEAAALFEGGGEAPQAETASGDGNAPPQQDGNWFTELFEKISNINLPIWLEVALTVVPFVDLIDIVRELATAATGGDVDELVLTLAVLGMIADAGWLSPEPATEALNGLIGFGKVLMKNVPPGPARDAIAEMIEHAAKNMTDNPAEIKRLWDVSTKLLGDEKLLGELMTHPEALEYVLRQGPEFLDRLAVHSLDPSDAARLVSQMSEMKRLPIPDDLPVPANLHGLADEVNMAHFLEGHTLQYLDPAQRVNKNLSTLWPSGTTADDVSNYLQEALDLVHAGGTPIAPGVPVTVRLSSGIDVQIGVRYDPITGRTIIGQFFPKAGPGLIQIPKADMQIINDMITP
ncbi:MAG: WXG100 family type VII secretion target [Ardenticatenales bacterium]|nr:WXG100 family type VII secretion target [Ardenticatenales bacterium]